MNFFQRVWFPSIALLGLVFSLCSLLIVFYPQINPWLLLIFGALLPSGIALWALYRRMQGVYYSSLESLSSSIQSYASNPLLYKRQELKFPKTALSSQPHYQGVQQSLQTFVEQHLELMDSEVRKSQSALNRALDAERASEGKSRFLASMSHELRTPLNALLGFSNLLSARARQRKALRPEQQQEYLEIITRSGETLLRLVNDILDLSKMEAGQMHLNLRPTNVRNLVAEILQAHSLQAEQKDVLLRYSIDPSVPQLILVDALRLKQVLVNLLSNSLKFTDRGSVELHMFAESNTAALAISSKCNIHVQVKDTGIGIPPDKQHSIFKAFQQVTSEEQATPYAGGTGLGLTIASELVKLMDGTICLHSEKGKGSTFFVELPVQYLMREEEEPKQQVEDLLYIDYPAKVLVVDDIPLNCLLLKRFLEDLPFEVQEASSGEQALHAHSLQEYDVILLDISMPDMDGKDVAQVLRQREKEKGLRPALIIAVTAHAMIHEKAQILESGCDYVLSKPVQEVNLKELIIQELRQRVDLEKVG